MNLLLQLADTSTFLLPTSASNLAKGVDWAWNIVLLITTIFFIIVVGAMFLFILKYRRRTPNDVTSEITHNTPLEIAWTSIPLVILLGIFYVGFKGFLNYDTPMSNSTPIEVMGHQWYFQFTYPNGAVSDQLYVVKDKPFVMNMQSADVLHALYIPAFRVQRNLIPGRTTNEWFIPTEYSPKEGFPVFCTQYCGNGHSKMYTHCFVLDQAAYDAELSALANPFKTKDASGKSTYVPYVKLGEKLYKTSGCTQCHSVDGTRGIGPSWKGLWKDKHGITFSASNEPGYTLSASDSDQKWYDYIRESIIYPDVKVVSTYQNVMPVAIGKQFDGPPGSPKDEELRAIITYIKSLGEPPVLPTISPEKNPELYDADKNPNHPESLAAQHAAAAPVK
jgi:cytochrome c oxidase subunit 2